MLRRLCTTKYRLPILDSMGTEASVGDGPRIGDAYGRLMAAYEQTGSGYEIVERDDGFVGESRDAGSYFCEPDDWPDRLHRGLEHVHGPVLDIGCGVGQHARVLDDRGHDVVGIDVSPRALQVARSRGLDEVIQLGIEHLSGLEPDTFETVLLLGNNLGLLGNADRAPRLLEELARITTGRGVIIGESRDPLATDKQVHLGYHDRNRALGHLPGRLKIRVRYERYATPWFEYLLLAPDTLADLVSDSAWTLTDTYVDDPEDAQYVGVLASSA